ncbi:hypothetical protein Tco_1352336 [Tanacetum coccineum]
MWKAAIPPWRGPSCLLNKDRKLLSRFFSVTPKTSHLNAVKRIFKYLKGKPNLGLWYPRESPFDLEAFSDSDYGGSNLDRKSTTGGCNFWTTDLSQAVVRIKTNSGVVEEEPRPLLPAMLLVATNPNAGQEHDAVAQSQPSSSTPPVPSTSSPPVQSPPPTPASIPTPTPIPETEPAPFMHTF